MADPSGAEIDVRRLSIPVVLAFMVAAACVGGTTTIIFIRINDLSRIAQLEAKLTTLDGRILGDRYPGWHRITMYQWCLQTERINNDWQCFDPYMLPSGKEEHAYPMLHPEVNRRLKTSRASHDKRERR